MTKQLTKQFRTSLLNYLKNPNNLDHQANLKTVSFAVFEEAVKKCGLEPDKYMAYMMDIIEPAVRGIKIHPHLGNVLATFTQDLTWSEQVQENQAFHALTLAYNMYLINHLLKPEQAARDELKKIHGIIEQSKVENNPYTKQLESAYVKLSALVDQHFKRPVDMQFKNQPEFERKLGMVCAQYRDAINSNATLKAVLYGFLATISSFLTIIGVSLSDTYSRKSGFFKAAAITPRNALSVFTATNIDVRDANEDSDDLAL